MTGLIAGFIFLYGMIFTSFFDVVGSRLPKKESLLGRSHCDHCQRQLRWYEMIPVIGYLIHRGKCPTCHHLIAIYHPVIEIFGGALFTISYMMFGFSIDFFISIIMISVLLIESISDYHFQIVIDRIWIIGLIPLIALRVIQGTWLIHIISSTTLFMTLLIFAYLYEKLSKKEALGGGDIKLFFFIGWILSPWLGFLSLFLASVLGLIYIMIKQKPKNSYIPLVPFITMGVFVSYYVGQEMIDLYLTWLRM